ncbi:hypothetical protein Peur_012734 [Populus x canadensis]
MEFNRFIFQQEGKLFQCCYPESSGEILGSENMLFAEGSLHRSSLHHLKHLEWRTLKRDCAGAEFSKLQMAIFLHHLVTKYRWRVIKGGDISRLPAVIFPNGFHIQILEKNI